MALSMTEFDGGHNHVQSRQRLLQLHPFSPTPTGFVARSRIFNHQSLVATRARGVELFVKITDIAEAFRRRQPDYAANQLAAASPSPKKLFQSRPPRSQLIVNRHAAAREQEIPTHEDNRCAGQQLLA